MTKPNFDKMNRIELRTYVLAHRDDEEAFYTYVDRLATEPVLARGTLEDAQDPVRFAEILERVKKIKQEHRNEED